MKKLFTAILFISVYSVGYCQGKRGATKHFGANAKPGYERPNHRHYSDQIIFVFFGMIKYLLIYIFILFSSISYAQENINVLFASSDKNINKLMDTLSRRKRFTKITKKLNKQSHLTDLEKLKEERKIKKWGGIWLGAGYDYIKINNNIATLKIPSICVEWGERLYLHFALDYVKSPNDWYYTTNTNSMNFSDYIIYNYDVLYVNMEFGFLAKSFVFAKQPFLCYIFGYFDFFNGNNPDINKVNISNLNSANHIFYSSMDINDAGNAGIGINIDKIFWMNNKEFKLRFKTRFPIDKSPANESLSTPNYYPTISTPLEISVFINIMPEHSFNPFKLKVL